MDAILTRNPKLTSKQFEKYSKLIKNELGIHLSEIKFEMLQAKLSKLTSRAGIDCLDEYYNLITASKTGLWDSFVDEITTHKTNFFREDNHFDFIKNQMDLILEKNKRILENNEIRVWSSACSTGDESYTIAMVLSECLPSNINIKILATDISPKVIFEAQNGEYILDSEDIISPYYLTKYFEKNEEKYCIVSDLKKLITFRTFNLMQPFPFKNDFDIIFCRNVMIYFDFKTQEKLINKFYDFTTQNGLLFIGHSESLNQKKHKYTYLKPTIYIKK